MPRPADDAPPSLLQTVLTLGGAAVAIFGAGGGFARLAPPLPAMISAPEPAPGARRPAVPSVPARAAAQTALQP